jgi:LDH2 family malate/lactate/ureidoglycolate dehydrogenase
MENLAVDSLRSFTREVLMQLGVPPEDADLTADCLLTANLRGVDTHGIALLPAYASRLQRGVLNPRPSIRADRQALAVAALNGDNGLGPVVGARAMDMAITLAEGTGIAAVTVRNSNHFGAAAWYAERAAAQGCLGFAVSNGTPALAPFGGRAPFFGANPLAAAIPAGTEPHVVFDMAASVSARARIRRLAEEGQSIPEGWAIDREGAPTRDPNVALEGALLPIAGPKGYGIVLLLEILAGVLSGAGLSPENRDLHGDTAGPQGLGHFFLAIQPESFLPAGHFQARMDKLLQMLHAAPTASGVSRVRVPGDQDGERRAARLAEGISVGTALLNRLVSLGGELGISVPLEHPRREGNISA